MGVYLVTSPNGRRFAWDPDGMYMAVRSVVRANEIRRRTRVVRDDQGWFLPTLFNVETNWHGLRAAMDRGSETYWPDAEMRTRNDPEAFFGQFVPFVQSGLDDQDWYRRTSSDAQHRSMMNISGNVDNWETAITVTRTIRDGSATVLIVAGSLPTGGAGGVVAGSLGMSTASAGTAVASVALGSAMRGGFTYLDTGNVGSAMINATGSFVTGVIPIGAAGAAMSTAETATLIIIGSAGSGATSGLQALAEGRDMRTAATSALVSTVGSAVGGVVGLRLEGAGFWVETAVGAGMDLATGAVSSAITEPAGRHPRPATLGRVNFSGLPMGTSAEAFVRATCLRPI